MADTPHDTDPLRQTIADKDAVMGGMAMTSRVDSPSIKMPTWSASPRCPAVRMKRIG